jgi:hypothetical protein
MTRHEVSTINKKAFETGGNQQKIQYIPCRIDHNGPAEINEYFGTDNKQSTLRGRQLVGTEMIINGGYACVVLDKRSGVYEPTSRNQSLLVWAHDNLPSTSNTDLMNCSAWIQLAQEIHK